MMKVSKFSALGFTATYFRIHVHDLLETLGIQGLLGLSFLKQLNCETDPALPTPDQAGRWPVARSRSLASAAVQDRPDAVVAERS